MDEELKCPYCGATQDNHEPDMFTSYICTTECDECGKEFEYSVDVKRQYWSFTVESE